MLTAMNAPAAPRRVVGDDATAQIRRAREHLDRTARIGPVRNHVARKDAAVKRNGSVITHVNQQPGRAIFVFVVSPATTDVPHETRVGERSRMVGVHAGRPSAEVEISLERAVRHDISRGPPKGAPAAECCMFRMVLPRIVQPSA